MLTKFCIVKAMVFPVVMYVDESYRCESWTIKKSEYRRIDAFELLCWKRLLRVPWTATRSKQSILKEINPEYYWKNWCWNSNTLATWCKELTHWKRPWFWERLKVKGEWDDRGWDGWMASPTQWKWIWASSRSLWRTGKPGMLLSMELQRVGHDLVTEQQQTSRNMIREVFPLQVQLWTKCIPRTLIVVTAASFPMRFHCSI